MATNSHANGEPSKAASAKTDSLVHVLVSLWEDYEKAKNADLPQDQTDILEKIMTKSKSERLYWDYSCASTEWYHVVVHRNWKLQDSSKTRIMNDVAELDCPILTYTIKKYFCDYDYEENLVSEMQTRADKLRKSVNRGFYYALKGSAPDFIVDGISNDYEYLLWAIGIYGNRYYSDHAKTAADLLEKELDGEYPKGSFLEFLNVLKNNPYYSDVPELVPLNEEEEEYEDDYYDDEEDEPEIKVPDAKQRRKALGAFSKKYSGQAIALFSDQQLLIDRLHDLQNPNSKEENEIKSKKYRVLRDEIECLKERREVLTGDERKVAVAAEKIDEMIEHLDAKKVGVSAKDGVISVYMQNVDAVRLMFRKDERELWNVELKNPVCSYFCTDTVTYDIPPCSDGEYEILCISKDFSESGKNLEDLYASITYEMRSISIAHREIDDGEGIYIADYKTGRPIEVADLIISHDSRVVCEMRNFKFNGFTSIQWALDHVADSKGQRFYVKCSYIDKEGYRRVSNDISFWVEKGKKAVPDVPEPRLDAEIFMDKAAFNPGDTIQFKALAYYRQGEGLSVAKNISLWAELKDPNEKVIATEKYETNDFGTISDSFVLPKECKGGTYTLYIRHNKQSLESSYLTVDEFVLPAYDLVFDKKEIPYFSGDTVSVRGKLTSYSGHSLSSVKVEYEIWTPNYHLETLTGKVITDVDGQFDIRFVTDNADSSRKTYYIKVKATAMTGETWEWPNEVTVNARSSMDINLENTASGFACSVEGKELEIMSNSVVRLSFALNIPGLDILPKIPVNYVISCNGVEALSGTAVSFEKVSVDFTNLPSGIYKIEAKAEYVTPYEHKIEFSAEETILKTCEEDDGIVEGLDHFYKKLDNGRIGFQFGTAEVERWFVVEVYDSDYKVIHSDIICLGTMHKTVCVVDLEYKDEYTDNVLVNIFSFKDSYKRSQSFAYKRPKERIFLPLSFASFTDKTLPHTEYIMTLQTDKDAEAVVSIFDKASETIRRNYWFPIWSSYSSLDVSINAECGKRTSSGHFHIRNYSSSDRYWNDNGGLSSARNLLYDSVSIGSPEGVYLSASYRSASESSNRLHVEKSVTRRDSLPDEADIDTSNVQVRDGMDHSTVFLPFLRSDYDGKIKFSFTTSDRASTYIVSVFAHDKDMKNAVLRREMVVSLPLELSVAQPQFLHEGDVYRLKATVSNSDEKAFEGNMVLEVYDTEDYKNAAPVAKYSHALTVGGKNAAMAEFELYVPQGVSTLGLKVAYIGTEMDDISSDSEAVADASSAAKPTVSDAIFVSIPVKVPTQTIIEAHSAVISGDADIEAAKAALAAEFSGIDATGAAYSEISLIDMITKAIPDEIKSESKDVISRDKKFYAGRMAEYLAKRAGVNIPVTDDPMTLIEKILSCRNSDGGFGWFEGFNSSPIITAFILEDFAILSERGLLSVEVSAKMGPVLEAAVKYLDNKQFEDYLYWGGSLSLTQYVCIRTMYPNVEFNPVIPKAASVDTNGSENDSKTKEASKITSADKKGKTLKHKNPLEEFKKEVKEYLLPKDKANLNGCIIDKARRVKISSVLSSGEGAALAKAWGLNSSVKELAKSVDADLISLSQYAVEHRSGGVYYPNAVLPFRGLLESEAYAHAFLCGLMEKFADKDAEYHRIAEGIRLWLMIQKETQQWDDDPAFLDAICMVLDGSDKTLNTRIAVLTKEYNKTLSEIKAAGNGFTVERKFYRMLPEERSATDGDVQSGENSDIQDVSASTKLRKVELKEGDVLNVGDKVIAEYHVWNEENRSFVRLETPRYAAFRPVDQLSGYVGGLARFIIFAAYGYIYPSAYREVKADKTILYFDVLAEENSTFTEEFYVTQAGTFASPVITVESAYAPHYRANDKAAFDITVE